MLKVVRKRQDENWWEIRPFLANLFEEEDDDDDDSLFKIKSIIHSQKFFAL